MKATVISIAIFALFAGLVFAQTQAAAQIGKTLGQVCTLAATILPVIAFVLFVLAGLAYAAGNFFGADARAKSVGWAMNMITGAVISFLLWLIGPIIISGLSSGNVQYSIGQSTCTGPYLQG